MMGTADLGLITVVALYDVVQVRQAGASPGT